jgi:hypothetical protein
LVSAGFAGLNGVEMPLAFEDGRAHGVAAPEHVRLRAALLSHEAVEQARALGFFGVWDELHLDTRLLLELLAHGPREHVVHRRVNDDHAWPPG